jgi:hypothetical protein
VCEECGNHALLYKVNGSLVCESCRNSWIKNSKILLLFHSFFNFIDDKISERFINKLFFFII